MNSKLQILKQQEVIGQGVFGWELILNLYGCSQDIIRSKDQLVHYAVALCDDILEVKRFGEPWAERFGLNLPRTAGFTIVQLLEVSSIVGHFSEQDGSAYINIFSCKAFQEKRVIDFSMDYFGASHYKNLLIERG